MPPNVLEMIKDLSDESTVGDFKAILTAQKKESDVTIAKKDAELQEMNTKILEIIEAAAKEPFAESALDPEIKNTRFFKAAASGKIDEVYKWQGRMVRNDQEWTESDWKIANGAAEKAALGTVNNKASYVSNDIVNSSQTQGNLSLEKDMAILSQAA